MPYTLRFSARFVFDTGVGQEVDSDLRIDFFEFGNASIKATHVLGTDENTSIIKKTDGLGVYYTTLLDVGGFVNGEVTAKWYAKSLGIETIPFPYVDAKCYPIVTNIESNDLTDWIKRQLGFPQVAVELSGEQLNDAVNNALEDVDKFIPRIYEKALDVLPGVTRYGPFDETEVGDGVVHVTFTDRFRNPHVHDPFFGISYLNELRGDFRTFIIANQFRETLEKVDSEEPEFKWDPVTRYLLIHSPNTQYRATLYFSRRWSVGEIERQWHQDFRRLALSYAREIIAEVRGKYEMIPTPNGGGGRLNYDYQINKAREERELIHQRMAKVGLSKVPILWDRS